MHKTRKRHSLNSLKIGSIGCQVKSLATPHRPHSLINLTVDSGRKSIRHRPAIHEVAVSEPASDTPAAVPTLHEVRDVGLLSVQAKIMTADTVIG